MKERLKELMLKFEGKRILVVGDIMLDKTTRGSVSRISPEAPVPILDIEQENYSAGGAGNVAANIASLGAHCQLAGIIGKDEDSVILLNTLQKAGVETQAIIQDSPVTIRKERILAGEHHILRIDSEPSDGFSDKALSALSSKTISLVAASDAIIISDYHKGTLTEHLAQAIINAAKKAKKPIVADAKPDTIEWYHGATLVSINKKEALDFGETTESSAEKLAKKLSSALFITQGSEDGLLFDSKLQRIAVPKTHLIDKSGAGDTTTATLGLSLACGATLVDAAHLANHAASIVISKSGISTVTINEVLALLRHDISNFLRENMEVKQAVIDTQLDKIERLANAIVETYRHHKKILIFGNGGSAADAQHFAAELVGRYKMERHGLPAIALTTDTSAITAIGNDYGFDDIFSRQVGALANPGDLIIGITTSGNSPNVLKALEVAKKMGCTTYGFGGKDGGKMKDVADVCIIVPSNNTPRIQETHITIIHIVCELLEKEMAPVWKSKVVA